MDFNFLNITILITFLILFNEYLKNKNYILFSLVTLLIIFLFLNSYSVFDTNLFLIDRWKLIFLILLFGCYIVIIELVEEKNFDIFCLITLVFIGSIVLISCDNFITLYLGLELQTFSVFILIAKNRLSIKSSEAALKYFILGTLSSGFFLLGITLLFLIGASLNIKDLIINSNETIVDFSLGLILLSFCFKLGLFPLHFWIPDIYEGSSWDIISLIATLPKISMLSVFIQILINSGLILSVSLVSIIIGTLGSLNQTKTKRLLGYSSISHMGFIMLGYSIFNNYGFTTASLYLFFYMITMLSIFILIIYSLNKSKYIIEISYLKYINKTFSITLILLILSIAGIPPLSGFISKWFLLWNTMNFGFIYSSFIVILFSAVGAGYYMRLVKIVYFQKKSSFFLWSKILLKENSNNELVLVNLGFFFFLNLFIIINFTFVIDIINFNFI